MTFWNLINLFFAILCWKEANNHEPWSSVWWFNIIASAANTAALLALIL